MMGDIYGLIGGKLGHSLSPQIHGIIMKKLGIKGTYDLFEVKDEELKNKIEELRALNVKGVNITIPYKTKIIKYLDKISPEAEKIGAINTLDFKNGALIGYNTDYYGFGVSLKNSDINVNNKSAVILGSGGASRAVMQYLLDNNIKEVIFVSRTPKATTTGIKDFKIISYQAMDKLNYMDIIINCTPCGMYPDIESCPVDKNVLEKFSTAVDLIYNPENTLFLRQASQAGLKTLNGLYMLVAQAAASQEIWQGIKIGGNLVEEVYGIIKTFLVQPRADMESAPTR